MTQSRGNEEIEIFHDVKIMFPGVIWALMPGASLCAALTGFRCSMDSEATKERVEDRYGPPPKHISISTNVEYGAWELGSVHDRTIPYVIRFKDDPTGDILIGLWARIETLFSPYVGQISMEYIRTIRTTLTSRSEIRFLSGGKP